jgi:hypothetical protein
MENLSKEARELQLAVLKQMLTLATSGFGLVAALAWNNVIQEFVAMYVKPYLSQGSGIVSLLLYAILVTVLAVAVTVNLSRVTSRLEEKTEKKKVK